MIADISDDICAHLASFNLCQSVIKMSFRNARINKIEDLLKKKLLIRQYAVETDIHPFVKGVSFEGVWKNRKRAKFGNTLVNFASLEDLIKMKRAAGRTQDLEDLKYLLRLRKKV